jgi:hypothetical protein
MKEDPIHDRAGLSPEHWYACSEPERPFDRKMAVAVECPKCMMKLKMLRWTHPTIRTRHVETGNTGTLDRFYIEDE